ncbi:prepilin-type N-terminal cleavage/methylation domain-containing protein [Alicyclobacillus acidiphilus]|uniref:prepilin-type N-terminal cleavage/methylation domain-containing protein n=1 Tax=Alicyclobacillus acidiphilus TaxID=182455 RepID=UPI0008324B23|nr:prepilin-type N-terminal cleavage/methylation domain-containing protein [Alicyclobacillus acidiphilus]
MEKLLKKLQVWLASRKNEEGVTLIELLAVVVIMSIIAAVAVPVVIGQINNSKVKADVSDEGIIVDAIQRAEFDYESSSSDGGYMSLNLPSTITSSNSSYTYQEGTLTDNGTSGTSTDVTVEAGTTAIPANVSASDSTLNAVLTNGFEKNGTGAYLDSIPTPQTSSSSTWTIIDLSDVQPASGGSPTSLTLSDFTNNLPKNVNAGEVTSFTVPDANGNSVTYAIFPTPNS